MKKFLLSLITLLCTLTAAAGNVVITLTDSGGSDSNSALTTSSTCFKSTLDDVELSDVTNKVYQAKSGYGWKFGSKTYNGSVTFTLPSAMNVKEIIVNAAKYGSDSNNLQIAYNGGDATNLAWTGGNNLTDYTLAVNGKVTSVTVSSSAKRMYVTSITLVENVASSDPSLSVNTSELKLGNFEAGSSAAGTIKVTAKNLTEAPTYSYSGDSEITVTGEPTVDGGTLNVTATSAAAGEFSGTLTVTAGTLVQKVTITAKAYTIEGTGEGTAASPYDVTRALSIINNGAYTSENVYVRGIISSIETVDTGYGNANYCISVDGTTGAELKIFRGKGLNNTSFTDAGGIEVGQKVVVYGQITLYSSTTPEMLAGNYLVSQLYATPIAINSVGELQEGKLYALHNLRANPYIPTAVNGAQPVTVANVEDAELFTLIASKRVDDAYYLYSTTLEKFLTAATPVENNFYVDDITGYYKIGRHTYNENEYFRLTSSANDCMLMTNGESKLKTNDGWPEADAGDSWLISEVGVLPTPVSDAAMDAFNAFEATMPLELTQVSELQEGKLYTLRNLRGKPYIPTAANGAQPVGTNEANNAEQFTLLASTRIENGFYLYSTTLGKFLTATAPVDNNYYVDEPTGCFVVGRHTYNENEYFRLTSSANDCMLMTGGSAQLLTNDGWSEADAGDSWRITEVGTLSTPVSDEAMAAFAAFEASIPKYIENPEDLLPGKAYTLTTKRGAIINSTEDEGFIAQADAADKENDYHKWAVVESSGKKYLYNIGTKKFALRLENTVNDESDYLFIGMTDAQAPAIATLGLSGNDNYPLTFALDGDLINVATGYTHGVVCDGWNDIDDGNCFRVEEVGDFDPTEAKATVASLTTTSVPGYVAFVSQKGDKYYALSSATGSASNSLDAVVVYYNASEEITEIPAANTNIYWTVEEDGEGGYYIKSYDNKYLTASSGSTNLKVADTPCSWTYDSVSKTYNVGERTFLYSSKYGYFRNYKATTSIGTADYADVNTICTSIRINPTVSVSTVRAAASNDAAYSITGQRIAAPRAGLYIIGGRKVIMK